MLTSAWDKTEQIVSCLELGARLVSTRYVYGPDGLDEVSATVAWPDTVIGSYG